jgi:hypothetical protein
MSRSFRCTDSAQFAAKRGEFADRKAIRKERRAAFAALGYDDPDAMAALPTHTGAQADRTREAFRSFHR